MIHHTLNQQEQSASKSFECIGSFLNYDTVCESGVAVVNNNPMQFDT